MDKELVLFDTDIGSDIDDAVCLAYLLNQPRCEILGITTVSGEPVKRAEICQAMLKLAGRDIPVIAGAPGPLMGKNLQPKCPQYEALGDRAGKAAFADTTAVEFMRNEIRKHPGEVTLLAVGPMTNLGLLFAADPEIPKLLKRLVLMIGDFGKVNGGGTAEWNARNDPISTAITYSAAAPVHRSIGLNVTRQVVLPADDVRRLFSQHELLKLVLDLAEVWFRRVPHITFHDPLAGVTIFDDDICTYKSGTVTPEVHSPIAGGATWFSADREGEARGPHEAAFTVDANRFFNHYFSAFGINFGS